MLNMKMINKLHLTLAFCSFLISACVAPETKTSDSSEEDVFQVTDDTIEQEGAEVQIVALPEEEVFNVEDSSVTNPIEEEIVQPDNQLPKGIQLLQGELADNSTLRYHVASTEELQAGRKAGADIEKFLELGLQPTVYFAFNQAALNDETKAILLAYVKAFWSDSNDEKSVKLILEGHTDYVGTTEYNLSLGLRRTQAVKNFIVSQGIDESLLDMESFGEERPVFENIDPQYQRYNRRVEIYFNGIQQQQ